MGRNGQILRVFVGVATTATVRDARIKQSIVFGAGLCKRIEGKLATVVNGERFGGAEEFARRTAIVRRSRWVLRGPFEQNGVMGMAFTFR